MMKRTFSVSIKSSSGADVRSSSFPVFILFKDCNKSIKNKKKKVVLKRKLKEKFNKKK
jgi:hypothetical protein